MKTKIFTWLHVVFRIIPLSVNTIRMSYNYPESIKGQILTLPGCNLTSMLIAAVIEKTYGARNYIIEPSR